MYLLNEQKFYQMHDLTSCNAQPYGIGQQLIWTEVKFKLQNFLKDVVGQEFFRFCSVPG